MSSSNNNNKKNDHGASLYAHQFAEEAKEEEMEAIASEDLAGAMPPQDAKKKYVVGSSKETPFAEEVKVEDQQKKATVIMPPQDGNDSSNIFVPAVSSSTADVVAAPSQQHVPGAFVVRGPGFIPHDDSFLHVDTAPISTNNVQDELVEQLEPESLFKAVLVDDPEIPSASIFDHEAAEKAYCRRQGWRVLATFVMISILGAIIAIVIRNKLLQKRTDPSTTSSPLFNFLAEKSFDKGAALSTDGSSQQKALQWLEQSTKSASGYTLLQFYALAVFYYATGETLSNSKLCMVARK